MNYMEFIEDDDFVNDDIEVLDRIEYRFPRRFYRKPNYYEEMDDLNFLKRFRLNKNCYSFYNKLNVNWSIGMIGCYEGVIQIMIQGPSRVPYLPVLANPVTRGEQRYNEALIRTRNAIERQNGLWKRRFRFIAYGLRLLIETIKVIIVTTVVLHNVARVMNEPEPPLPEDINEDEINYLIEIQSVNVQAENPIAVNHIQNELIRYFNAL